MRKNNKLKYGGHSRPSPLLNEDSASNLESFLETPYGEHSRPAPLSPDIWKPHIYVYDKNNAENTIVQGTPSEYVLVTTQDSNLAGKTFFQNGDIQLYVDYTNAIKDELHKDKLRAFGIQMNESYIKQQQEKERQEKMTADSKNSKQINSVGDIIVKDSLPLIGDSLQILVGGVGTTITLGLNQDVKDFTDEAVTNWAGKYTDLIEDTTTLTKDLYIDPMVDGEWLTLLNNAMVNLGETMDVITGTTAIKYMVQNGVLTSDMNWKTEGITIDLEV